MNASVAYAEVPYKTYTHTGYGYLTETQAAYVPGTSISKIGDTSLVGARDMMITEDGEIYIADTGNKRILVSDLQGNYIKEFGADVLMNPCGIFVTKDKLTYVADRDAEKIFVFDAAGKVVNEYGKPNHPLYGDEMSFMPLKIVVNNAGIMFIICEANMNGIVHTNYTTLSIIDKFKSIVSTDEQKAKKVSNKPATPDNLAIDEKGLIYTVTRGKQSDNQKSTDDNELKRLNIAGKNIINPDQWDGLPVAVAAGNHDNVYMVSQLGYVYEFSNEGEMLFVFGGSDDGKQRVGLSKKTEAISVDKNDNIYILDSDMNKSTFAYSNKAMGRALLQEDNYFEAMKFAKLSYDYTTYSDSFWEIRNIWISNYLIPVVGAILVLMIILRILKRLHKKYGIFNSANEQIIKVKRVPLISRVRYSLYFMKHPIDGSYGVRWEGKASYLSANILLAVFIAINVIYKYYSGFLYKPSIEGYYSVLSDIGTVLIAFLILIGCNYLICTINDGEGSFKQIYCAFVYCLTPYIIFQPVVFLLTHVFTINEKFLIQAPQQLIIAWIVILIFITIKEINNITLKETVKVIALTFFAVLIVLLVAFVLYLLWSQVLDFIQAIGGEAVHRLGF
ncbi:MAG: pgl1, partial [Herbinix sp.]|nr:pgl1 [Herbinix sp.]